MSASFEALERFFERSTEWEYIVDVLANEEAKNLYALEDPDSDEKDIRLAQGRMQALRFVLGLPQYVRDNYKELEEERDED